MSNDRHYLETELSHLFESEHDTWRFVQSASLDGVWYWDLENPDNLWISPEYWECLGIDPKERMHSPAEFIDVVFEEDLPKIMENLEQHYADPTVVYEQIVRFKHADGSTVWVRCRGKATRDKDGKAIRMLGAHNNITALKKAEEKTQLLMKNRERFFARMSHEIRTPLHGILGITESLQDHNLDPFILSQLSTIIDCGKQLQHLLNDLLTISKIDEGKFSVGLEDVSLAHLFAYIDSLFRARADAKSLRFWLPDLSSQDVYVRSDQVRLTQIVSNLVSNAIKFTQVGEVLVEIKENDSTLELIITDTGNGIKDIDAALMAYHQEQTAKNMVVEGTGLGLEIVKKLCDALGHTLKITSTVGKGTTINIGLQKAIKRESDNPIDKVIEPSITEHCEPKTILIVDDNEINREIAKTMLQNLFPTVHSASNGEEAVNMVRTQKGYDVILMDLSMPIKNGYDAAREINTLVLNREARIIAVSADAFEEISHKCAENGIKQHVAKPFTKKSLLQAIRDPNEHLTF